MPEVEKLKVKIDQLRTEKNYLKDMVGNILNDMDPKSSPAKRLAKLISRGKVSASCYRCGKPLISQKSIAAGMGPVCLKKDADERQTPLRLVASR